MPYYLAYPMPLGYEDERRERQDYAYMKSLYPKLAKDLLPLVEEECQRMAYAGSMIYDEYPDWLQLHLLCRRICRQAEEMGQKGEQMEELVQVMVYHELYYRRAQYRKEKKQFYLP